MEKYSNLINYLDFLGLDSDKTALDKYKKLTELTLEWNEKINVTAVRNPDDFVSRNIIDSLSVCVCPEFAGASNILDLGTGGGFPGLPLAIAFPEKRFVLLDCIAKKLNVAMSVAKALSLSNVSVVHGRAEELANKLDFRESFNLVVTRAVSSLPVISEYCLPFVKPGGFFIPFKTMNSVSEISESERAFKALGAQFVRYYEDGIEGSGHILLLIEKLSNTPKQYPRKSGTPLKNPIL